MVDIKAPEDPWVYPFGIKIMNNFLEEKYQKFMENMIQTCAFYQAPQGVGNKRLVQKEHKIRFDYTLSRRECSFIDEALIQKADCGCNLRERWRLLYYNGDTDEKGFRDPHTDWTSHACHRRMSIIIGLSEPSDYEGGEFHWVDKNIKYKIEKGTAVIFDSRMVHEVLPVTKGKRYVLQAFLFDDTGYDLKKEKNGKEHFVLLPPSCSNEKDESKEDVIQRLNMEQDSYKFINDRNMVHSKIKSPEDSFLGEFTEFHQLYNFLLLRPDIYAFTWHEPTHNNKRWAKKAFGWTKELTFEKGREDFGLWPRENDVISGILNNKLNKKIEKTEDEYYITNLSSNGGPGNQVVGIKELLIMATHLNRTFVAPPIIQHYVLNREHVRQHKENKYWQFTDIFDYKDGSVINLLDKMDLVKNESKVYCVNHNDRSNKLRSEEVVDVSHCELDMLFKRRFTKESDYLELNIMPEKLLILKNLFNSTAISKCFWNGCDSCELNENFLPLYRKICSNFDFSSKIKSYGDKFIENNFGKKKFISLHLRYPDQVRIGYDIKQVNKLYNESDIQKMLEDVCKEHQIDPQNIFIATCSQRNILSSTLKNCKMLENKNEYNQTESFIEQYISTQSDVFVYTGGIHAKPDHVHLRSTWASFVIDYRNYLLGLPKTLNIYLTNYFSKTEKK